MATLIVCDMPVTAERAAAQIVRYRNLLFLTGLAGVWCLRRACHHSASTEITSCVATGCNFATAFATCDWVSRREGGKFTAQENHPRPPHQNLLFNDLR